MKMILEIVSLLSLVEYTASGSLPPKLFGTGQPKIVEMSQTIDDQTQSSIWKPSSPAIILPINAFGQTLTPSIDSEAYPTNVSASMGRTAYLKCRIKNLGHKSVSWVRHNKTSLISVGKYKYIRDDRFRIVHEHHDEDWILAIKSVKEDDQGVYECQVNASPLLRQTFYLSIVEPYTEIIGGKDLFIDQHSSINLTCTVHSPEPPAHIFWMKNGKPVLQSTSVGTNVPYADRLRLLKAKRETTNLSKKKYMSVKFENGTLVSRDAVEEWHPNNEKLKSSITKLSTYEKEVYKTEFSGHDKRDVSEMGVSVVTAIQGRMSLIQTLKSGTTISSLLVEKTNPSDSGTYQCIPSNTGPATINVHVLDGESTDALQTSGLSTFTATKQTLITIWFHAFLLVLFCR